MLQVSKLLEDFDVEEKEFALVEGRCPNIDIIHATVTKLNVTKQVRTRDGISIV